MLIDLLGLMWMFGLEEGEELASVAEGLAATRAGVLDDAGQRALARNA